ncbi:hypothetical protein MTBBW1_1670004 [Desulfamplus magnetovallimortis]|uniref:Uncharacterized protein n=1 Tax=Desulfamplus magnetovallimortis TaxID=1246637 RepID=A0A1W1H9F0_9BACT|nr:hypothetical protein [Desulfamplus magnetovallimortis]SLM28988.1 hypothetical protein MTBBW1_1670004 [Desulfamplus magnetovallimortis]
MGFTSQREFAVFKTLENVIDGDAKDITHTIFKELNGELSIAGWWDRAQVMKSMRVKIKGVLKGKVEVKEAQKLASFISAQK